MNPKIVIRSETAGDVSAITEVTIAAFRTLEISNHTEQFIVAALREAGFGVKLKEHSFYQPVSLGAAHAIAQQRLGLLATLSDDVYQKGLERLAEEAHTRGAATLIGSEFTLVEIVAVKGEQPKPKRRRPSFRKPGEEAADAAGE